jgi:hypothetical protein
MRSLSTWRTTFLNLGRDVFALGGAQAGWVLGDLFRSSLHLLAQLGAGPGFWIEVGDPG